MIEAPRRIIAIDWSGDKTPQGQRRKIWVADWNDGSVALADGRTRQEVGDYLIAVAQQTPDLVVGLDFSFSFPAWFLRQQKCPIAEALWQLVASGKGEEWLTQRNDFCWGGKGSKRPTNHDEQGFRQTELQLNAQGHRPKSTFQIKGAGTVGTGSLRGIPVLQRLHQAGFCIWPFNKPGFPVALEIYPRLFTGPGNKSSAVFRAAHLTGPTYAALPEEVLIRARNSEDAFDALCSVIAMKDHAEEFASLQQATDPVELLEGQIWRPAASPESGPKK